jgi:proteasome accessory factor C
VRHPGTTLAELSSLFGVSEAELTQDLDLLFVSGLPPYGPGDLIDVRVEDGSVWIDMADYFDRPLRLTRNEALALYLRATALAATPGLPEAPALRSALEKLAAELDPEELGALPGRVEPAWGQAMEQAEDALLVVREAAERSERVEIEYYAASSAETSTRRIDPEEVFSALGHWYVVAWDERADAERMFRADRIRRVTPTGERFRPRGLMGAGRPLYSSSEGDLTVRLALTRDARWIAEYYDAEVEADRDGVLTISLPAGRLEWLTRLLVRVGSGARVLAPPQLQEAVADLARATLRRYDAPSR